MWLIFKPLVSRCRSSGGGTGLSVQTGYRVGHNAVYLFRGLESCGAGRAPGQRRASGTEGYWRVVRVSVWSQLGAGRGNSTGEGGSTQVAGRTAAVLDLLQITQTMPDGGDWVPQNQWVQVT